MDHYTVLSDIFPNKSSEVIQNIIRIVEDANMTDPYEYKLESMINLLAEIGGDPTANQSAQESNNFLCDELLDEATGGCSKPMLAKLAVSPTSQTLQKLIDILPNADPSYLEEKAKELVGDESGLEEFITTAVKHHKYPTMEDYLKNEEKKREKEKYTKNFHINDFLKLFPDPTGYFNNPNRKHALMQTNNSACEEEYALTFLQNYFNYLRPYDVTKVFKSCNKDLVKTSIKLKRLPKAYREPRHLKALGDTPNNILLLQEIAFIQNESVLADLLKFREQNYQIAKEQGLLQTCQCCFYEDLIPEECFFCKEGCIFCKDCIKRGAETSIGQQNYEISCFAAGCHGEFSLSTLQMVLETATFKGVFEHKQIEEIKKADIEGLECCPQGCNYVLIPHAEDKIFHCELCQKDSCRECGHLAHIPLKCKEVEYDEDVKMRTYIENKMSESLIRKCVNCNKVFIKSSGCNKISCSCGAIMCYLCGNKIKDYTHFTEATCPLFTDDNKIHMNNVLSGVKAAKAELGVDVNPDKLKFDPARDLSIHFN